MDAKAAAPKDTSNDEDETLFKKLKPNYGPTMDNKPPPVVPDKPKFDVPSEDDGKIALDGEDGDEERSVAGRKTMKLPKGKDTVQIDGDEEDPEVKEEMNDILKRAPSIYLLHPLFFHILLSGTYWLTKFPSNPLSHYILQILLPAQHESQVHPP